MWTMFLGVLYYAAYASYIFPDADYETMVRIDVLGEPVGLALAAAQVLYMNMRRTGKPLNALHFFLFIMWIRQSHFFQMNRFRLSIF